MAKFKKKTAKATASKASANTNTNTSSKTSNTASSKKSAFNFADMSSFTNPTQFMSQFTNQATNFQPANMQQMMERIMQTGQKNIEAFTACTQLAMERAKEAMEEQASFANRLIQETTSTMQETIGSANDPKEKMEEMADWAKYIAEKSATHARKSAEETMQVAQKISTTLSKRLSDTMNEINNAA